MNGDRQITQPFRSFSLVDLCKIIPLFKNVIPAVQNRLLASMLLQDQDEGEFLKIDGLQFTEIGRRPWTLTKICMTNDNTVILLANVPKFIWLTI